MKVIFNPPQLGTARQAATIKQLAPELAPPDCFGELRVLQSPGEEAVRLVVIQTGRWPASIELPRPWLYEEHSEYEIRERLAELFHTVAKPVLA